MTGTFMSREPVGQARRAWETAEREGQLEWLENPAFIPASCFAPPFHTSQIPRAWERVAVPRASASRLSDYKIYKRITATPNVDKKYQAVVAELESQGFGERKRARAEIHVSPYGGAQFEERMEDEASGQEMLDNAREQVMRTLQALSNENLPLHNSRPLRRKPSTYDPAQLTWVPRKRHNTRWPVNPPDETCDFIAELQPLIKFELHPSQIDEIDETQGLHHQHKEQPSSLRLVAPEKHAQRGQKQRRGYRRRTLRPSLSTISEVDDEPPAYPVLTPGAEARPVYTSPMKSVNGAGRFRTPTKVAESPMKAFTITATHVEGGETIKVTNANGHFQVPSPTKEDATRRSLPIGPDHPDFNHQGHFCAPYDVSPETTTADPVTSSPAERSPIGYLSALPFFDAPVPVAGTHDQSGHEAKRRLSLDNARRSDRRSDAKIMKRVNHSMEGTTARKAKKRRHSELPDGLAASHDRAPQKRRHTLDVDVGRNLDIFGQQAEATTAVAALPISAAPSSTKSASTTPTLATTAMGDLRSIRPAPVNQTPRLQNLDFLPPVSPTAPIGDGGSPVVSETKGTGPKVAADVELEVDIHSPREVDDHITGVVDQAATNANDRMARAVAEGADIDGTAAEQNANWESQESQARRIGNAAILNGDVFSEKAGDVEGDSALADLHNFVRRAKNTKERKDAPATTALIFPLANSSKRRSDALGSATPENGSPTGRIEKTTATVTTTMTSPRVPLGQKDANKSPSPPKKRKLRAIIPQDATAPLAKKNGGRLVAPDLDDYDTEASAQPKKRRRKVEAGSTGDVFNPDMFPSQDLTKRTCGTTGPGPDRDGASASRRSSRIATVQKAAAIPVRLPGLSTLDLGDMPTPAMAAVMARKADRDLAAQTRANTHRNRGGAMPVAFVLASLGAAVAGEDGQDTNSDTMAKTGVKSVRWDKMLARVQGEDVPVPTTADNGEGAAEEDEETALPPPPQLRFASNPHYRPGNPTGGRLANEEASPGPVRRSARSAASRLPTRGGSATPVKKKSSLPSPGTGSSSKSPAGGAAAARARLGMAGPGTPGPRRGGRRR